MTIIDWCSSIKRCNVLECILNALTVALFEEVINLFMVLFARLIQVFFLRIIMLLITHINYHYILIFRLFSNFLRLFACKDFFSKVISLSLFWSTRTSNSQISIRSDARAVTVPFGVAESLARRAASRAAAHDPPLADGASRYLFHSDTLPF